MSTQNSQDTALKVVGRPFPAGVSCNPGGRPRGLARLAREMTKDGEYPLQFLLNVQQGKVKQAKVRDRVAAAEILLDRGFGKSTQLMEAEVQHTVETPYSGLNPDQLRALIQITDQMHPDQIQAMIDDQLGVIEGGAPRLVGGGGVSK